MFGTNGDRGRIDNRLLFGTNGDRGRIDNRLLLGTNGGRLGTKGDRAGNRLLLGTNGDNQLLLGINGDRQGRQATAAWYMATSCRSAYELAGLKMTVRTWRKPFHASAYSAINLLSF